MNRCAAMAFPDGTGQCTLPQDHTGAHSLVPPQQTGEQVGDLQKKDITDEQWREYDFDGRVYRIDNPRALYYRDGGSTHRVVDVAGVVHCVPAPGAQGCVLRWFTGQPNNPVQF